jgi:hypothetical protein
MSLQVNRYYYFFFELVISRTRSSHFVESNLIKYLGHYPSKKISKKAYCF